MYLGDIAFAYNYLISLHSCILVSITSVLIELFISFMVFCPVKAIRKLAC
jgi:hypothetical protein